VIKLRAILRRRYAMLLVATAFGGIAGGLSSIDAPKSTEVEYVAEQVIVVNRVASQNANVAQDSLKVTRGAVPLEASRQLGGLSAPEELAAMIKAAASTETNTITLTSTDRDRELAKKRVGVFADVFVRSTNADLLKDQQRRIDDLQQRADEAAGSLSDFDNLNPLASTIDALSSTDPIIKALVEQRQRLIGEANGRQDEVRQAMVDTSQDAPYSVLGTPTASRVKSSLLDVPVSPLFRSSLLGLFGLLLGTGLVMIIERANPRIDTRDELVEALDAPVLAEVGRIRRKRIPVHADGRLRLEGAWAEPYRRVRSAIQFVQESERSMVSASTGNGTKVSSVFLVTSAHPSEGKSTSAALISLALVEAGVQTLVVGGDFRKPSIQKLLGVPNQPSLQDRAVMAVDRLSIDQIVHAAEPEGLWVVPSGPSTREVTRLTQAAKEVIAEGSARGATVIVDSSPIQAANDTIDLLGSVDQVILVVRSGEATAAGLNDSVELIKRLDAHLLGVVLVGTPGVGRLQNQYYSYYTENHPAPPAAENADEHGGRKGSAKHQSVRSV
jgi:Mrp family chromosome partitioning ATPase